MRKNQCWVCLRITPKETLRLAHQVWAENPKIARKMGLKAANIIKDAYLTKPIFFCGQSSKGILSGLLYLLGFQFGVPKQFLQISELVGLTEVTIRRSRLRWLSNFPKLFPEFGFQGISCIDLSRKIVTPRLYPTFKGKRVNVYYKKEEASE